VQLVEAHPPVEEIVKNVAFVRERIRLAAERSGRQAEQIRLVAVTKYVSPSRIQAALEAGVSIFGESRLQEALPKIDTLADHGHLAWHFIGRLQRRKVKAVIGRFELIHSVDSLELAAEIDRRAQQAGLCQPVLVEVNVGEESSKNGFRPAAVADALGELDAMASLSVRGLMAIPPLTREAEAARPFFRQLRDLAHSVLKSPFHRVRMDELSMGMSNDYEIAVEEGATLVRVGTAIFGARPTIH
jgi:PLP dependent protein